MEIMNALVTSAVRRSRLPVTSAVIHVDLCGFIIGFVRFARQVSRFVAFRSVAHACHWQWFGHTLDLKNEWKMVNWTLFQGWI